MGRTGPLAAAVLTIVASLACLSPARAAVRHLVFVDTKGAEALDGFASILAFHQGYVDAHVFDGDCQAVGQGSCKAIDRDNPPSYDPAHGLIPTPGTASPCGDVLAWWKKAVVPVGGNAAPFVAVAYAGSPELGSACEELATAVRIELSDRTSAFVWVQLRGTKVPPSLRALASDLGGRVHARMAKALVQDRAWRAGWAFGPWEWQRGGSLTIHPGAAQRSAYGFEAKVRTRGWRPLQVRAVLSSHSAYEGLSVDSDGRVDGWWLPAKPAASVTGAVNAQLGVDALKSPRPEVMVVQVTPSVGGLPGGEREALPPLRLVPESLSVKVSTARPKREARRMALDQEQHFTICSMAMDLPAPAASEVLANLRFASNLKTLGDGSHPAVKLVREHLDVKKEATGAALTWSVRTTPVGLPAFPRKLQFQAEVTVAGSWARLSRPCRRRLPSVLPPAKALSDDGCSGGTGPVGSPITSALILSLLFGWWSIGRRSRRRA